MRLVALPALAQTERGSLQGTIKTADGQPAEFVTIVIQGSAKGTTADKNGNYLIKNITPGRHILLVSFIGLQAQQQVVEVLPGQVTAVNFTLVESARQLAEVVVLSSTNLLARKESDYIARMPLKNLENPQSYNIATKELLKEQDVTDFVSALRAIPGAGSASTTPYQITGIFMRGFSAGINLRNGLFTATSNGGDPQVIEQLEAIKGPSGTLFGTASSYGGLLNRVTKKPVEASFTEVGLNLGSFSFQRITADVNTPLNADKTVLLRVNTAYHTEISFQDVGKASSFLLAPSLLYKASDRLSIQLDAEINANNQLSVFYNYGPGASTATDVRQLGLDYDKSYSSNDLTHRPTITNFYFAQATYAVNDRWRLSTNLSSSNIESNSGVVYPAFFSDTQFARGVYDFNFQTRTLDIQANLNGEFAIGKLRNRVLIGLDNQNSVSTSSGGYNDFVDTVDVSQPAAPVLNVAKARTTLIQFSSGSSSNRYAVYVSDVINLTDRLNVLLSLRLDHFRFGGSSDFLAGVRNDGIYSQNALSPKLGATYQLIKNNLSVFANYLQTFNNVAPTPTGQTFRPEKAYQLEGGLKLDLLDGKLSSTLSYYHIEVKDKVRPLDAITSIQDGTQVSRGIDADLVVNPVSGLNLVAGYGNNNSRITKAEVNEGNRPGGVPIHSGTIWTSYTLQKGSIKGLGAGFGLNHNGQVYYNDANNFSIPEFTTLKASLFYSQANYRLSLTVNNLSDQRYWNYVSSPQMPRQVLGSLSVRF